MDRMLSVITKEEFTFYVGKAKVTSDLAEAVLISPKIYGLLSNDQTIRSFVISDNKIEAETVQRFLSFVRCRDSRLYLEKDAH
jgi:hypothetical protein